jgi:hypothetical protein
MNARLSLAMFGITAVLLFVGCASPQPQQPLSANHPANPDAGGPMMASMMYSCPMHKEVQSDQPGKCPKCGMKLTINAAATQPGSATQNAPAGHVHEH